MKYHLIGICGCSMSGLARILKQQGHKISGCDINKCKINNLKINTGHSSSHISKDLDGLIISAAITPASFAWSEVENAKKLNIPVISRAKIIGRMMQDKIGIAVSGMHGKTTVCAMISMILEKVGYAPTFFIGGEIPQLGNSKYGKGQYLVAEACEWARQFLDLRPKITVITNIEEEHLDTYPKGLPEIKRAFKKFVHLLPKNGLLILWQEDPLTPWLTKSAKCRVKTFSSKKTWPGLKLKIPGKHNILNALAAARVCHELKVPSNIIKETLNNFTGAKRRFEIKGEKKGVLVVDDYGHHPSEIKATLAGARDSYQKKRIICIFQPHQFSRTKLLLSDFAKSFSNCDKLIIAPIFIVPGRDPDSCEKLKEQLMQELIDKIKKAGQKDVEYFKNYDEIIKYLIKEVRNNDLVITMGATKIYEVGEKLLNQL